MTTVQLVCAHCGKPGGCLVVQTGGKGRAQQPDPVCIDCGADVKGNYDRCYACNMWPGRKPGRCVICAGECQPEYAACRRCKSKADAAVQIGQQDAVRGDGVDTGMARAERSGHTAPEC